MANKDIKLNIKVDQSTGNYSNTLVNKLALALGLSVSTAVVDSLDLSDLYIAGGLAVVVILSAIFLSKAKKTG